ncbi:MAG: GNAT family N-acetyltransferase [Clostridiales bacterium]|nr:GNAT family N-acetyltransferase [Clostridiales bacterium]
MIYKPLDDDLEILLNEKYKDWAGKHIHKGADGFTLVAYDEGPVGFVSVYKKHLPSPLEKISEAFIDVLKVDDDYKRKGIGSKLVSECEQWAQSQGLYQIRAWSSMDKVEVLPLWHHLGYTLNPAEIWIERCEEVVKGVYVSRRFYE